MDNSMFPDQQNLNSDVNASLDPSASQGLPVTPPVVPPITPMPVTPSPAVPAPPTKSSNKVKLIILIIAALVLVLGVVAVVIVCLANNNDNYGAPVAVVDEGATAGDADSVVAAFENLTKDEAVVFLQSREDDANGVLPKGYVDKAITDAIVMSGRNLIVSDLVLIYSYDDMVELRQMACKRYNVFNFRASCDDPDTEDNFEITEYDYYAIVTPNRIKEGATSCDAGYNSDCNSLFSFKRGYLNHYMEETSPNSYNDVSYMNARDPEVVNELLRTFTFFVSVGFGGGHGNIYSYSFEEQEDRFVLTVNYVGVGINAELLKNPNSYSDMSEMYAINLYARRYAADKADGRIYGIPVQTEPETSYSDYVKSFPITQAEISSLLGYEL